MLPGGLGVLLGALRMHLSALGGFPGGLGVLLGALGVLLGVVGMFPFYGGKPDLLIK